MVAATRIMICVGIAFASLACGVVLPPPDDGIESDGTDPVTTKGANLPAPDGEREAGATSSETPSAPGSSNEAGADATAPPAPRVYTVFVTSQAWGADEIGGLAGADAKCATLANATADSKNKKWAAWLSAGSTKAPDRLGATPGPWSRIDGVGVATDKDHVVDTLLPLFSAISVDEKGSFHGDSVWTGTRSDGDAASDTCNGWQSTNGRGVYGKIDFTKPAWTNLGETDCGGGSGWGVDDYGSSGWSKPKNRLYCFEID